MKKVVFNNFMCKMGQKKVGVHYGGDYILNHMKITNPINTINFRSNLDYSKAYHLVENNIYKKNFNFNLGGDHSVAVSTIQPLLDIYNKNVLVVWIDAHPDVNTFETSKSKNTHGMPVATLLGITLPKFESYNESTNKPYKIIFKNTLSPNNLLYFGVRAIDSSEKQLMESYNLKNTNNTKELINLIKNHPASKIHISCDVDGINPELIPSTGTKVKGGLEIDDILSVIDASKKRLTSFDLVEFNPYIGNKKDRLKSLNNISRIVNRVIR